MKSCDLTLLSKIIDGLDYDDAVLCAGINNKLNKMYYAGKELFVLQGRGIYLIDELLDRLKTPYELLKATDLYDLEDSEFENLLLIIPYMDISKIREMKTDVVQVIHAFSTFLVKRETKDRLGIYAEYDEGPHEDHIEIEDLIKLQFLKVKPLESACKIIHLTGEKSVSQKQIQDCILEHVNNLRSSTNYEDETGGWVVGSDFYDEFAKILRERWDEQFGKIEKYMILQSIQNGSAFFYRKELGIALENKYGSDDSALKKSGNIWRRISRILKASILSGKCIDQEIYELLENLKEIETNAIDELEECVLCVSR